MQKFVLFFKMINWLKTPIKFQVEMFGVAKYFKIHMIATISL